MRFLWAHGFLHGVLLFRCLLNDTLFLAFGGSFQSSAAISYWAAPIGNVGRLNLCTKIRAPLRSPIFLPFSLFLVATIINFASAIVVVVLVVSASVSSSSSASVASAASAIVAGVSGRSGYYVRHVFFLLQDFPLYYYQNISINLIIA